MIGSGNPSAGYPVIASIAVVPVAGGPEVVGAGGVGLLILGERWRRLIGLLIRAVVVALIVGLCGVLALIVGLVGIALRLLLRGVGLAVAQHARSLP